jgi:hypothetical protein
MFDNLSQREKVLAGLVGSLVPLALLVMAMIWFFGQQSARSAQIEGLRSQIATEKERVTEALDANQRRLYYRSISVPSNFQDATNDYQQWIKKLVRDDVGMTYRSLTPKAPSKLKFGGEVIGRTESYSLLATTDLEQMVEFLTKFYELDLLHRIKLIQLVPKASGTSRTRANIRNGQIALSAEIEVLSLVDANIDEEGDFLKQFRALELTADEYRDSILKRNIFGPANNTPTISVTKSASYYSDKDLRIPINGKDADKNQKLVFSLVDPQIKQAKLEHKKPTDRRAYLTVPKQPEGKYTFKVRVADDGQPPKSSETEFTISVKEKVVKKAPTKKPPKPKFKNSRETRITAIVKDKTGAWQVWINVRTKGEKLKLKEGESFTLDGETWKVTSIDLDEATFSVEGKSKTFGRGQPFDGSEKTASLGR